MGDVIPAAGPRVLGVKAPGGGGLGWLRGDALSRGTPAVCRHVGRTATDALPLARRMAQNAPMKIAIYMVGALALIVIGSLAWSTSMLAH
jgi:hypothetical protein